MRLVLLLLLLISLVGAEPIPAPADLPGPPRWPPAPLLQPPTDSPPPEARVHNFSFQPGWNAVSFPFARVLGCQGFDHGLLDSRGRYLDTSQRPLPIVPGQAYWAYSDRQQDAVAWGEPLTETTTLNLEPGWNFLGSPLAEPLDFSQLTFGDGQQVNRLLEEAALGSSPWLDSRLFSVEHDRFDALDVMTKRRQLLPGRGYWLYAYKPLSLRVNDPREVPIISSVERGENHEFTLKGEHFGDPAQGRVVLNTGQLSDLDVLEWTPTQIRIRVPPTLQARRIAVVAGGAGSPRLVAQPAGGEPEKAQALTDGEATSLRLTVLSEENLPIANARVEVAGQPAVVTGRDGLALLPGLPAGPAQLKVTAPNYLPRSTSLTVPATTAYRGAVTLYSPRSTMYVRATPCQGGWRPYRIEIYQKRNWWNRAWKIFPTNQRLQYAELFWSQCPTNTVYCIEIYWRNHDGMEKRLFVERKLGYYGLQETFYNYWGYY